LLVEMKTKKDPWIGATAFTSVKDKLPRLGQSVTVATPFACCVGFLGPGGVWREACDGARIERVESWHAMEAKSAYPAKASSP
jgi:hypothetical protein